MTRLRFVLALTAPLLLLSGCEGGWFGNTQWGDEGDSGSAGDDTGEAPDDTAAEAVPEVCE